jgi:membrane protease YdiL (CAAX protease family)
MDARPNSTTRWWDALSLYEPSKAHNPFNMNIDSEVPTKLAGKTCYWKINLMVLLVTVCVLMWEITRLLTESILSRCVNSEVARLSQFFLLLLIAAVIASRRSWRLRFPISFQWTWTVLLAVPFLLLNVVSRDPSNLAHGIPLLMLVLIYLGVGLYEELFFRGFAFLGGGLNHPRYTVLFTSFVFSLVHLAQFDGGDWVFFLWIQMIPAFTIGLVFGTIRVVTGSLAWPVVLHWLVNLVTHLSPGTHAVSNFFGDWDTTMTALQIFNTIPLLVTLVVLFRHPALRPRKAVELADTLPPPEPVA